MATSSTETETELTCPHWFALAAGLQFALCCTILCTYCTDDILRPRAKGAWVENGLKFSFKDS